MSRTDFCYYFLTIESYANNIKASTAEKNRNYYCFYLMNYVRFWNKIKDQFSREDQLQVDQLLDDPNLKEVFLSYLLKYNRGGGE